MDNLGGYKLTAGDERLIRGMNTAAAGAGNIGALHFDGKVLIDLVQMQRELEAKRLGYFPDRR